MQGTLNSHLHVIEHSLFEKTHSPTESNLPARCSKIRKLKKNQKETSVETIDWFGMGKKIVKPREPNGNSDHTRPNR
ncbi:hypothetical protein TNIN_387851 [Trichonephila inaurata madagascariensis]|uniref:Uncharacterized protein n=1 Tax=Trichonephila inaurata madagascariensis TaxID=2747483 RepID=A0A8X6XLW5_9ARAC|nr:hypothetical protein TNIN_387851 [Trichonephila inaurata madagascariensis]